MESIPSWKTMTGPFVAEGGRPNISGTGTGLDPYVISERERRKQK